MRSSINYTKGYRYQLECDAFFDTPLRPVNAIITEYIVLLPCGQLIIRKGYAWNGPNFPAFHTAMSILASLPHDALYQLIALELLKDSDRRLADVLLESIVSEPIEPTKLWHRLLNILRAIRGSYYYQGVDLFGGKYSHSTNQVITICPPNEFS